jgi:flagellar protein FlgJ
VAAPKRTAFRAYGSVEESVADFAKLLASSPRYKEVLAAGGNAQSYIESMGKSGYATDPEYANKLNEVLGAGTIQAVLRAKMAKL